MRKEFHMNIFKDILITVFNYLKADWAILLVGVLLAVFIKTYIDDKAFKKYLNKHSKVSIGAAIGFGAFTPLCACGTMAVLLSMFISSMPWGPVMAFLVSSPLTSPSQFMYQTSFLGMDFAVAVLISSLVLGTIAGLVAHYLSTNTKFFHNQFRMKPQSASLCCNAEPSTVLTDKPSCCSKVPLSIKTERSSCCAQSAVIENKPDVWKNSLDQMVKKLKLNDFLSNFIDLGIRKVLFYFVIFIAIGRIVELMIPQEWVLSLFGEGNSYSVPLGASIGLPLYVSSSAALPLMKSFLSQGASQGALLAFLITGKATGIPVIAGMSAILKKRAIAYYVLTVYLGGIAFGWLFELYLAF